ncbi:nuclear transport factor 2 family protein [Acinetobacter baylyi]|uniref:nuclear transport factor 2 family protein n=1 Tax=Acinetobacter baylyi TaxID=202950 RepID=UPI000EA0DD4C|nr:nuclear transport factor 2 family protein [Acinetobacter baylyi]
MFKRILFNSILIGSSIQIYAQDTTVVSQTEVIQRLERLESYNQVKNVMGSFVYLLNATHFNEIPNLFALDQKDVRSEMAWGVYEGASSIKRLYTKEVAQPEQVNEGKGQLNVYNLTTPVIEVAKDLKTAKGVWIVPSVNTGYYTSDKITANWGYTKYAADFINVNGEWKIWHLHQYGIFMTPYEKSWMQPRVKPKAGEKPPSFISFNPDHPSTTHWNYSSESKPELVPVPPKPYEQFNPKDAY